MKTISFLFIVSLVLFSACSGGGSSNSKKVMVIASGKIKIDEKDKNTILFDPGGQHNEQVIELGGDKVTLTVQKPDGKKTFDLTKNGLYLLNLKTDTVVGGVVNYGSAGIPPSISKEQLDRIIDSTQQLMECRNSSDEKKTYCLPPMEIKKISSNTEATILGPYKNIPYSVEVDKKGNPPETYKFFTNTQKRESLQDLLKRLAK